MNTIVYRVTNGSTTREFRVPKRMTDTVSELLTMLNLRFKEAEEDRVPHAYAIPEPTTFNHFMECLTEISGEIQDVEFYVPVECMHSETLIRYPCPEMYPSAVKTGSLKNIYPRVFTLDTQYVADPSHYHRVIDALLRLDSMFSLPAQQTLMVKDAEGIQAIRIQVPIAAAPHVLALNSVLDGITISRVPEGSARMIRTVPELLHVLAAKGSVENRGYLKTVNIPAQVHIYAADIPQQGVTAVVPTPYLPVARCTEAHIDSIVRTSLERIHNALNPKGQK